MKKETQAWIEGISPSYDGAECRYNLHQRDRFQTGHALSSKNERVFSADLHVGEEPAPIDHRWVGGIGF